jgi:hypothetical protein
MVASDLVAMACKMITLLDKILSELVSLCGNMIIVLHGCRMPEELAHGARQKQ